MSEPLKLVSRIDSTNAPQVEAELLSQLPPSGPVVLDAEKLSYISSAGLRIFLRIRKTHPSLKLINVSPEINEILELTGFTELFQVERALRSVSIDGCEVIGRGAKGTLYRIAPDTVVKVYHRPEALAEILHERELAKLALILGLPTAISYDVVKVGQRYGSVFELLNARTFSQVLAGEPERLDWCVEQYVRLLKQIHGTQAPAGKLPRAKDKALMWVDTAKPALPEAPWTKLRAMVEAVPDCPCLVHGDYHTKNLMCLEDEVLLIDMDTLSVGDPIFELGNIYNAFLGFYELDHKAILDFQGYSYELGKAFWEAFLPAYLGTTNARKQLELSDKARIMGYTRLISRLVRHGLSQTDQGQAELRHYRQALLELLEQYRCLSFRPNELELEAEPERLGEVQAFVDEHLEAADCSPKAQMQIGVAVEEIFVNISSYAYHPENGKATVRVEVERDPVTVTITFLDHGVPYDPLTRQDPDVHLAADVRAIGGLGIFLTKKLMDEVSYAYRDGQNILTLKKKL